mmetsp:Transcript_14894/g.62795  ORF Transcript_14894/g.62795 Transcript_14894/m.62795 type:complete len:373 (+) Transcript_14894:741-1859(+)
MRDELAWTLARDESTMKLKFKLKLALPIVWRDGSWQGQTKVRKFRYRSSHRLGQLVPVELSLGTRHLNLITGEITQLRHNVGHDIRSSVAEHLLGSHSLGRLIRGEISQLSYDATHCLRDVIGGEGVATNRLHRIELRTQARLAVARREGRRGFFLLKLGLELLGDERLHLLPRLPRRSLPRARPRQRGNRVGVGGERAQDALQRSLLRVVRAVHVLGASFQRVRRPFRRVGGRGQDIRGRYPKRVHPILRGARRRREEVLGADIVIVVNLVLVLVALLLLLLLLVVVDIFVVPGHPQSPDVLEVLVCGVPARGGRRAERGDGLHGGIRGDPVALVVVRIILFVLLLLLLLFFIFPFFVIVKVPSLDVFCGG